MPPKRTFASQARAGCKQQGSQPTQSSKKASKKATRKQQAKQKKATKRVVKKLDTQKASVAVYGNSVNVNVYSVDKDETIAKTYQKVATKKLLDKGIDEFLSIIESQSVRNSLKYAWVTSQHKGLESFVRKHMWPDIKKKFDKDVGPKGKMRTELKDAIIKVGVENYLNNHCKKKLTESRGSKAKHTKLV